jgi:hypothetical protein
MFKNIYLNTDWGILDCLGDVAGVGDYDAVLEHSEFTQTPFGKCRVLNLDGIIRAKEAAGRPHDLRALTELKIIREKIRGGK